MITVKKTNVDIDKVWKALAKYGIHSEKELNEAIKNMKPLNIGCMISPVNLNRNQQTANR